MTTGHHRIAKSAGLIGLAILCSRILGFVRDVVIAAMFGTGASAQAFVVAFRVPNMMRDLVAEGATNAAIVPVFSGYRARGEREEFWRLAWVLAKRSAVVLLVIVTLGVVAAPLVVRCIAPGFAGDPERFGLTVLLTRLLVPYLLLIGLTAFAVGVLNADELFAASSWGQSLLNIMVIICAVWLAPQLSEPVVALAIGTLVGGVLQLGVLVPSLVRRGFRPVPGAGWTHPGVTQIHRLLVPRTVGSGVYQLSVFIDTVLASLVWIVGEGGVAALYYANRLIQFPLAIFGVAVAQASLPAMSAHVVRGEMEELRQTISFTLRVTVCVMIPASVGLAVAAEPIVRTLFERGAFDVYSTDVTTQALVFYSIGLSAYAGMKLLTSVFYAMHDTKTPTAVAAGALATNLGLNLWLMYPLKVGGLALATSISSIGSCVVLFVILQRRLGTLDERRIVRSLARVVAAAAVMGTGCWLMVRQGMPLAATVAGGVVLFLVAALALRVEELRQAWRMVTRRLVQESAEGRRQ